MKTTLLTKAVGAFLLSIIAFVAHAVPIALFDNPAYVDTNPNPPPPGSADSLQAALSVNNMVTPFTDISAAGFMTALQGEQILVIPEGAQCPGARPKP